jgi:hypothetical protein
MGRRRETRIGCATLTVAATALAAILLVLSPGATATQGFAAMAGSEKVTLESSLSIPPSAIRGIASAAGPGGARVMVVSGSYAGATPETAPVGGYEGTSLIAAYDAKNLQLLWENTTMALPSVSGPVAIDRDGDGVDEVALWGSGHLLWFDLSGRLLADTRLENESNPVARTPTPAPINDGSGPPDLLLAGRHGNLMRVSLNGTIRWSLALSNRPLVGELIVAGRDSSGNSTAYVSDGSSNPTFAAEGAWTGLAGSTVFLVDTSHGILLNSLDIPGEFPPVSGALAGIYPAASGVPNLIAANGSGTIFQITLTSTARGAAVYAAIPAGAPTGFNALVVCPEGAWGQASLFEHVGTTIYAFESVGSVWNRSTDYGGLIVGLQVPQRDSCAVGTAQAQGLTLYDSANGTDAGTLALPYAFTPRIAAAMDLDGDGWLEIVISGQNTSRMTPSIVVLTLAPLMITPTGPSLGAVEDVWAGGSNWTDAVGELSGLPSPLPFDAIAISVGSAAGPTTPSYSLGNSAFLNATGGIGLWVDAGNSSLVVSGGWLNFSLALSAGWNYKGPPAGPLTIILSGPTRPPVFINTTIWLLVHWTVESVRAPFLSNDGVTINSSAWVSPASRLSVEWGPLRYATTTRLVWRGALNWSFNATPSTQANLTTDTEGGVRADWQFSSAGPIVEPASVYIGAQLSGGPAFRYSATFLIDRQPPQVAGVSPEANNSMWFSSTRLVLGSRVCDNESGVEIAGVEVRLDGAPVATRVVAQHVDGECIALLLAFDASEGEHEAELLVRDVAGNPGAAQRQIPLRIDLQGLQFSQFWPTIWTSEIDVAVGCTVEDVGGSGIDLGELQWAFAGSPAGPFRFAPAGETGAAQSFALREVIPGAREGYLFAQFSGRDLAGNNRSFSPIILVRIDRTAPQVTILNGLAEQVRVTPAIALNLSLADGLSGLDLDGSWVRWENESSNATVSLSAGQVTWMEQSGSALVLLSLSTPFGWSNITLTVLDRAGNSNTLGPYRAYLNVAPHVNVRGIVNGSIVDAGVNIAVAIDVEDEDGSPWTLTVSIDGATLPGGAPTVLNVAPGHHRLVVNVTDAFGLRNSVSIDFFAEARAPTSPAWFEAAMIFVALVGASAVAFMALRAKRRPPA